MADNAIPHFHNDPGVPTVKVGAREFMCMGASPPFDHPHIFMDLGDETEIICPYCSTRYLFVAALGAHAEPAICEWRETA